MGASLAPIGLEGQVNRRPGAAVRLSRPLLTSAVVAVAAAILGLTFYQLDRWLVLALFTSITAGGATHVVAAVFQSRLRFSVSLALSQGLALVLVGMGAAAVIAGGAALQLLAGVVALYYVVAASTGWGILAHEKAAPAESGAHSLFEGLSLLGITAAALLLMQLERLLTPRLLTLEDLATFAVVATLVGSPFRMLQMGAGYTLLPRLSSASTQLERQQLVRREVGAVTLIGGAAALALFFAAPWIAGWLLAGKYHLSAALMIAALVSGAVKLGDGVATTIVWALGSTRQLAVLNWVSWTCAAVGVAAAWLGAQWGLIGLMYGVTFGWICRGGVAAAIAAKQLNQLQPVRAIPTAAMESPS
jgi:O-antigen/teichoic acid export membrane protein